MFSVFHVVFAIVVVVVSYCKRPWSFGIFSPEMNTHEHPILQRIMNFNCAYPRLYLIPCCLSFLYWLLYFWFWAKSVAFLHLLYLFSGVLCCMREMLISTMIKDASHFFHKTLQICRPLKVWGLFSSPKFSPLITLSPLVERSFLLVFSSCVRVPLGEMSSMETCPRRRWLRDKTTWTCSSARMLEAVSPHALVFIATNSVPEDGIVLWEAQMIIDVQKDNKGDWKLSQNVACLHLIVIIIYNNDGKC